MKKNIWEKKSFFSSFFSFSVSLFRSLFSLGGRSNLNGFSNERLRLIYEVLFSKQQQQVSLSVYSCWARKKKKKRKKERKERERKKKERKKEKRKKEGSFFPSTCVCLSNCKKSTTLITPDGQMRKRNNREELMTKDTFPFAKKKRFKT